MRAGGWVSLLTAPVGARALAAAGFATDVAVGGVASALPAGPVATPPARENRDTAWLIIFNFGLAAGPLPAWPGPAFCGAAVPQATGVAAAADAARAFWPRVGNWLSKVVFGTGCFVTFLTTLGGGRSGSDCVRGSNRMDPKPPPLPSPNPPPSPPSRLVAGITGRPRSIDRGPPSRPADRPLPFRRSPRPRLWLPAPAPGPARLVSSQLGARPEDMRASQQRTASSLIRRGSHVSGTWAHAQVWSTPREDGPTVWSLTWVAPRGWRRQRGLDTRGGVVPRTSSEPRVFGLKPALGCGPRCQLHHSWVLAAHGPVQVRVASRSLHDATRTERGVRASLQARSQPHPGGSGRRRGSVRVWRPGGQDPLGCVQPGGQATVSLARSLSKS